MNGSIEPGVKPRKCDVLPHAALILNAGLALALASAWLGMVARGEFWRADFNCYYFGGVMVLEGHGNHLYDRDWQKQYQARIVPERGETDGLLAFIYPPQAALFTPLFALLPRTGAFYAWSLVQLALLIPLVRFLR